MFFFCVLALGVELQLIIKTFIGCFLLHESYCKSLSVFFLITDMGCHVFEELENIRLTGR